MAVTHIKIFISCPGDVSSEKDIATQVCNSINHAQDQKGNPYHYQVLDFRNIVSSWNGRPQNDINTTFSKYDIYLGILWMRYGTPSGENDPITGKPFQSGTEEEFIIAKTKLSEGRLKKIIFFFKDPKPCHTKEENEQYGKVLALKEELMPSGWVNLVSTSTEFAIQLSQILNIEIDKISKEKNQDDKIEFTQSIKRNGNDTQLLLLHSFIRELPPKQKNIQRSFSIFKPNPDKITIDFGIDNAELTMPEILEKHNKIVLLGNAGSGKSTELSDLAHHFNDIEESLIPVFKKLNTYVNEDIDNFLPEGWKDIPQNICLIILDGLDEVEPQNFNTAVKKLITFTNKYPQLKIVVSCRTNFYELPTKTSAGTLSDFAVVFINGIHLSKISEYANSEFGIEGDDFLQEALDKDFKELLYQPFFLNILLRKFKAVYNLNISRVQLLNEFVEERIEFDQKHFSLTTNLKQKKPQIIKQLKKLALVMEYMGKNYLHYSELQEIFPDEKDIELLKFSTAFKSFQNNSGNWGFEHNNIQEFLAASALNLLSIEEIKNAISFNNKVIKPSWTNTLFFLMGIIEESSRTELISWILEIEPEILVKIEPDKVDPATRMKIFENIFEHYKRQAVWLRSNKFTTRELAHFAPNYEAILYLLNEIRNTKNSRIVRLNALQLLGFQDLNGTQKSDAVNSILQFIKSNPQDPYIFHSGAIALVEIGKADREIINDLMANFGHRNNQYIRLGFYQLIYEAKLTKQYFDYILAGLRIVDGEDRFEIDVTEEGIYIKNCLLADLDYTSTIKLIDELDTSNDPHHKRLDRKQDLVEGIISSAINLYPEHTDLFDKVIPVLFEYARIHEEWLIDKLSSFFIKTNTTLKAFTTIFGDSNLHSYQKGLLYKRLLNKQGIDYVFEKYQNNDLNNKELENFINEAKWYNSPDRKAEIEYLDNELKEKSRIVFTKDETDYNELRRVQEKENIDLLFDAIKFKQEVISFFEKNSIEELDWDGLWAYKKWNLTDKAEVRDVVFDLLSEFGRNKGIITLQKVLAFIDQTDRFEDYLYNELKQKISRDPYYPLGPTHLEKLKNWVLDRADKLDITAAIRVHPDRNSYNFSSKIITLWHFIKTYKIALPKNKILDFTTFDEPNNKGAINWSFKLIEEQAGRSEVIKRVTKNLLQGIEFDGSWENNAVYAIENRIVDVYEQLLFDFTDNKKSIYSRVPIIRLYAENIQDFDALYKLISKLGTDDLRWEIFSLLINKSAKLSDIEKDLLSILSNDTETEKSKYNSSKFLTQLQNFKGTKFYIERIADRTSGNEESFDTSYLLQIRNPIYIEQLIKLLKVAAPQKINRPFLQLDNVISEALQNIALVSEANLNMVKIALLNFIEDNLGKIENVNFYYPMIERMEHNFYLSKSNKVSVTEALKETSKFDVHGKKS